jgi:serine/threonine-protein kinase
MAPEQARGELLDERSDLFSLGSTFFHILTGNVPFQGASVTEVLANLSAGRARPLRDVAPDVPAPLAVIIERLMQPDPLERYQEASVALRDLESYLRRGRLAPRATTLPPPRGRVLQSTRLEENQLPTRNSIE